MNSPYSFCYLSQYYFDNCINIKKQFFTRYFFEEYRDYEKKWND